MVMRCRTVMYSAVQLSSVDWILILQLAGLSVQELLAGDTILVPDACQLLRWNYLCLLRSLITF